MVFFRPVLVRKIRTDAGYRSLDQFLFIRQFEVHIHPRGILERSIVSCLSTLGTQDKHGFIA